MSGRVVSNSSGGNPRELGRLRRGKRRAILITAAATILVLCVAYLMYLWSGHPPAPEHVIIPLLYLLFLLASDRIVGVGMRYLWLRDRQAANGAVAEEKIGALLKKLPDDCVVLDDIDTVYGNIDHLVLRKDGAIFLIETKSHRGRITEENGELRRDGNPIEKNILRHTTNNVFWLQTFLKARLGSKLWIHSAIVFPNASVEIRDKVRGVSIITATSMKRWMWRSKGNPYIAALLWPHIKTLKADLQEQSDRNNLR